MNSNDPISSNDPIFNDLAGLKIDTKAKSLGDAFGFTEKEFDAYVTKEILPFRRSNFNIYDAMNKVFNARQPLNLRVVGIMLLGRIIGEREAGTSALPHHIMKSILADLCKEIEEQE